MRDESNIILHNLATIIDVLSLDLPLFLFLFLELLLVNGNELNSVFAQALVRHNFL